MTMLSRQTTKNTLLRHRKKIVIVAPHPDDEVFGCGLLIAAALRVGIQISVIVLTDGQASHSNSVKWPPKRLAKLRRSEARRGLARLGGGRVPVRFLGWKDGTLAQQGCGRRLRTMLKNVGADIALVTSPRDFHQDHQAAFTLTKQAAANSGIAVVTYEVWSRVNNLTKRAQDLGLMQKRWAAAAHRSQSGSYIVDDPSAFAFDANAFRALVYAPERYAFLK